MSKSVIIGKWHEMEAREINRCPSYYAADHETLRVSPGDYDARLAFEGGYNVPMPYWLLVGIDCSRVSGALYSGFGGLNFASTELEAGEQVKHTLQMYSYGIPDAVKAGKLTLNPEYDWLLDEVPWNNSKAPKTWQEIV